MAKRIVAGAVGLMALAACFFAFVYAIEAIQGTNLQDFGTLPWWSITAELLMCSMALGTLIIGFRFLDFAFTGRTRGVRGRWVRPIAMGCGLFFPVFVAALAIGFNWAYRMSYGNQDQNALVASRISFFLGVAAAIVGSAVFLRRARSR